jgi:polysaccharide export outer membrane protein
MNSKFVSLATIMVLALLSIASGAQDRAGPAELRATTSTTSSPASPAAPAPTHATAPDALVIGPGDLLEVSLYGIQDFKAEARVGSNQQVSLPMLGSVTVGGLTTDQAEKVIADKLVAARLYNNPQVQVLVKEYTSEGISVLGEVQKPGIYQLLGARRLYDAISSAGGMTKTAGRFVLITHRDDP